MISICIQSESGSLPQSKGSVGPVIFRNRENRMENVDQKIRNGFPKSLRIYRYLYISVYIYQLFHKPVFLYEQQFWSNLLQQ